MMIPPQKNGTDIARKPQVLSGPVYKTTGATWAEQGAANALPNAVSGLIDVLQRRAETWLAERLADAAVRQLRAKASIIEARRSLVSAELTARQHLSIATRQTLEEEMELSFHVHLSRLSPQAAVTAIQETLPLERILLEREALRRQRFAGTILPAPLPTFPTPSDPERATPAMEVSISDEQIEKLALRAVTRFSGLDTGSADGAWAKWRNELYERFPRYAAEETVRRAQVLQGLTR